MNEWKPIESAPKSAGRYDGRALFLYGPHHGMVKGYWSELFSSWVYGDITGRVEFEPTHWQPLPPPPH